VIVGDDRRAVRRINHEQTGYVRREAAGVVWRAGYELNRVAMGRQQAAPDQA
jgi:hypothetical protein